MAFALLLILIRTTDATALTNILELEIGQVFGPSSGLVVSGDRLFGTTSGSLGTIFRVNKDGSGFQIVHTFAGGDGIEPRGELVSIDNVLYGTTKFGGKNAAGTIYRFKLNVDGTDFSVLHTFRGLDGATIWAPESIRLFIPRVF